MLLIVAAVVLLGGPLLLGLAGLVHGHRRPTSSTARPRWPWRLTAASTLLYVLAFNLTFFIQELFLVVPKALTPGLRPTLFHNNHTWTGDNPLASLFQGTGALATLVAGALCALLFRRGLGRTLQVRLFLLWMAYCGIFMALPQVVIGALVPQNDLGMAMDSLHLGAGGKTAAALVAIVLMPLIALGLGKLLLGLADQDARVADARARTCFVFQAGTLPALAAIPLIVPFRVPREWIEVLLLPLLVTVIGFAWIQAGAWRFQRVGPFSGGRVGSIVYPLISAVALLLIFQLLLRPGVPFY